MYNFDCCNSSHWHASNDTHNISNGEPLTRNIHEYPIRGNDVIIIVVRRVQEFRGTICGKNLHRDFLKFKFSKCFGSIFVSFCPPSFTPCFTAVPGKSQISWLLAQPFGIARKHRRFVRSSTLTILFSLCAKISIITILRRCHYLLANVLVHVRRAHGEMESKKKRKKTGAAVELITITCAIFGLIIFGRRRLPPASPPSSHDFYE